ncbi:hypothetical protein HZS_5423 [Henneguya salminicola]|nr:hypothetical protein HZS_5423 [Henneguya salminicola]
MVNHCIKIQNPKGGNVLEYPLKDYLLKFEWRRNHSIDFLNCFLRLLSIPYFNRAAPWQDDEHLTLF